MAWDTPDLSSITDAITDMLDAAAASSPLWTPTGPITKFNITASGGMPDEVRDDGDCQLSLSLLHVGPDPSWRNTPVLGPRPLVNAQQPFALVLTYLLTAYAGDDFHQEQQAMSIALACLHAQPIHKTASEEFTITIEPATLDELSRLWQSITVPMRLGALFRVAVVFLSPRDPPATVSPPPDTATLVVAPAPAALNEVPQLFQAASLVTFLTPVGGGVEAVETTVSPAVVTPGAALTLGGTGLDLPQGADVYLSRPDGTSESKVTPWRKRALAPLLPPPSPPAPTLASKFVLELPATVGPLPGGAPAPGLYLLAVGRDGPQPHRSAPIPIVVAPRIDDTTPPTKPELAPGGGGVFAIEGEGFTPGATEIFLDTIALATAGGATPGPGEQLVAADGRTVSFRPPAGLPAGRYHVRVRVNGVEAPPAWWFEVP